MQDGVIEAQGFIDFVKKHRRRFIWLRRLTWLVAMWCTVFCLIDVALAYDYGRTITLGLSKNVGWQWAGLFWFLALSLYMAWLSVENYSRIVSATQQIAQITKDINEAREFLDANKAESERQAAGRAEITTQGSERSAGGEQQPPSPTDRSEH